MKELGDTEPVTPASSVAAGEGLLTQQVERQVVECQNVCAPAQTLPRSELM